MVNHTASDNPYGAHGAPRARGWSSQTNDENYTRIKDKIMQGKTRIPYLQYVKERTHLWVKEIASIEELQELQKEMDNRIVASLLTRNNHEVRTPSHPPAGDTGLHN